MIVREHQQEDSMRNRITLLGGALIMAIVSMLAVASPANAAAGTGQCSIGGYNFVGTVTTSSQGVFNWYHVQYLTGSPVGLEWRVRIYNGDGSEKWDSQYNTSWVNSYAANIYVPTYGGSRVYVQIGRLGDGYPTCVAMNQAGL